MRTFLNRSSNGTDSSAAIVDGNLILTLPDAINPVIWKMELGSVKSSAIEVRASGDQHVLTLKTPKGDAHDIAPFERREQAVDALLKISHALSRAEGRIAPTAGNTAPPVHAPRTGAGRKWTIAAFIIFGLLLLASFLPSLVPPPSSTGAGLPEGSPALPPTGESGVPLSADDYLQGF